MNELSETVNALRSLLRFVQRLREDGLLKCDDNGPELFAEEVLSKVTPDA